MIAEGFAQLDGLAIAFTNSLKTAAKEGMGLSALTKTIGGSARAMDRAAIAADRFDRSLAALRLSAASMPAMPMLPGGGGGGGGYRGGGGHGNGFHGGNVHMGPGGIGIGTVGMAAGDAFVPLAIAAGIGYAGHALYESAKDLDTERARFKLFGLSDGQNAEAFRYVDSMHVYGSTRAENMRNFREAQGVFRESGESDSKALAGAKLAAPILSQLNLLASTIGGETGAKLETANLAMLRYVELSGGLSSAAKARDIAEFGWKLNVSSGGQIDWAQLLAFKKTAGSAGYNLSNDALARIAPLLAELGGGRAGTADMTSYNRIMGITRVPNQVAHAFVEYGLWDPSRLTFNASGGIKNAKGNPLSQENSRLFHENPELFYEQVLRPIYAKMKLSGDEITRENALIFGRTGGAFFSAIERTLPLIQKSVDAVNKVPGIAASVTAAGKTLTGQEKEFGAAWTDFKTQFGTSMLPFFTGILKGGSSILRLFGDSGDQGKSARFAVNAVVSPATALVEVLGDMLGGGKAGSGPKSNESPFVSNAVKTHVQVETKINLDGRAVAKVVSEHQGREMARPQGGTSSFDGRQSLVPAGS